MLKICRDKLEKNENKLRKELNKIDLNRCGYEKIVKLTINSILNDSEDDWNNWDVDNIHKIDDGDFQGTLLFIIPKRRYQPASYDYLITYVEYGSCSGCDTLHAIQYWNTEKDENGNYIYSKEQLDDFMTLCRDILFNVKRPFYDKFVFHYEDDYSEVE